MHIEHGHPMDVERTSAHYLGSPDLKAVVRGQQTLMCAENRHWGSYDAMPGRLPVFKLRRADANGPTSHAQSNM